MSLYAIKEPLKSFTKKETSAYRIINAVSRNDIPSLKDYLNYLNHSYVSVPGIGTVEIPLLHYAARLGRIEAVDAMIEVNGNAHVTSDKKLNLLHLGAILDNCDLIEIGAKYGLNPRYADCNGNTPLMLSALHDSIGPLKMLISEFPNGMQSINQQNYKGNTALMLALQSERSTAAKELIKRYADIYIENDDMQSTIIVGKNIGIDVQKIKDDLMRKEMERKYITGTPETRKNLNMQVKLYNRAIEFVNETAKDKLTSGCSVEFNKFLSDYAERQNKCPINQSKLPKIKIAVKESKGRD